jgi:hypothetical protein
MDDAGVRLEALRNEQSRWLSLEPAGRLGRPVEGDTAGSSDVLRGVVIGVSVKAQQVKERSCAPTLQEGGGTGTPTK